METAGKRAPCRRPLAQSNVESAVTQAAWAPGDDWLGIATESRTIRVCTLDIAGSMVAGKINPNVLRSAYTSVRISSGAALAYSANTSK